MMKWGLERCQEIIEVVGRRWETYETVMEVLGK